jgi:hypothetical protein
MDYYSKIDKLLHQVSLGNNSLGEFLYDIEKIIYLKKSLKVDKSVYVSGLARAGTTTLMRGLNASHQFASLTYNDMPFILSPNLWGFISKRSNKKPFLHERAHGDRIFVDHHSPEAFEEVFWRVFHGDEYITEKKLKPHSLSAESIQEFYNFQRLVCSKYNKQRYLSKNNNNLLRIKSLASYVNNGIILVPFRHPLDQAKSLLNQHLRFKTSTNFEKKYMTWLSHHEFGAEHRPFEFGTHAKKNEDLKSIEYWLVCWCDSYTYILNYLNEKKPDNVFLVSYEKLCSSDKYWPLICDLVEIPKNLDFKFTASKKKPIKKESTDLVDTCMKVYNELDSIAL